MPDNIIPTQVGVMPNALCKSMRVANSELTYDWRHHAETPANTGRIEPVCTAMATIHAMERSSWSTDAHFVPYVVVTDDGVCLRFPRVTESALPWLADHGFRVRCTSVVIPHTDPPRPRSPGWLGGIPHYLRGRAADRYLVVSIPPCDPSEFKAMSVSVQERVGLAASKALEWWRAWPLRSDA